MVFRRQRTAVCSPARERRIRRVMASSRRHARYPVLLTLARAGLRPGEAFGLQWDALDFVERTLHVERTFTRGSIETMRSSAIANRPRRSSGTRTGCRRAGARSWTRWTRARSFARRWRRGRPPILRRLWSADGVGATTTWHQSGADPAFGERGGRGSARKGWLPGLDSND